MDLTDLSKQLEELINVKAFNKKLEELINVKALNGALEETIKKSLYI